ncbi:16S rRNA (adenine1518-N6/adenine1519-N6)-dimethyltransferase [Ekhidna lutea]|uniref:Ribosomal RNA small subunit methyltransferase A n=1 Tax=Ekhidna lutea TaxID=447679 RepID=A0A239HLI0_EKHLU|nr:16S rRNA (adenine(1518)-N(6)/adenine(1519)-N(6))-dimethyltransferase RsmA [Ekhidna lutea]SNS81703.1 16S rRNA (adenine1518-N6/adenine1519-N6)-dimethyltransferase [Ekhidna lutea]
MASVKPKKHLGQHFLKDENIALKIVDALKNETNLPVLEIGPGTGVLTKYLIENKKHQFYALDVDTESIDYLRTNYPLQANQFLFQDYLKYDVPFDRFNVIGNFPYNISSQLFFKIWDDREKVDEVVCMIQKEVADRICEKEGSKTYGILSVLLQAFFDIEYLFKVPPGVFNPPPKVQSAVIRLKRNKVDKLSCDEKLFKRVVKAGFGKRRKTLRNALKDLNLPDSVAALDVMNQRAEQLSVQEFISLTEKIS